ncbi:MAG: TetR family transcriptional regulator [Actinobacteria bacterium]|nr:TetR family transcriptional regulator [Actinomycetota bacterium]
MLNAACAVFAAQGFDGATMEVIAARAGTTNPVRTQGEAVRRDGAARARDAERADWRRTQGRGRDDRGHAAVVREGGDPATRHGSGLRGRIVRVNAL